MIDSPKSASIYSQTSKKHKEILTIKTYGNENF